MLVKVKQPFFDDNGLHRIGEVVEVKDFNALLMEEVKEIKETKTAKKRVKG